MGLDLDFIIQDLVGGRVLQDAPVSAHLVPGQTWEGDVLLREAQDRDVVDPVVLDLRSAIRKTLHLHLGADLSRQDALVVDRHAEDCCIGGSICRDRAGCPDYASDRWGSCLLSIHRKSPSYQGCPQSAPSGCPDPPHEGRWANNNESHHSVFCYGDLLQASYLAFMSQ